MAEAVVSLAIERISSLLIHEAAFLHDVRDEVQRLQAELKRMCCFLRDADQRQEQDERIRNLVAEIRDVAYLSEDVIDTFILAFAKTRGGPRTFLQKLASIFRKPLHLHKIGSEIRSIWAKLEDISKSLQRYDIKFVHDQGEGNSARSKMQRRIRRTYPHAEEDSVFGLEDSKKHAIAQLMVLDKRRRVVSIVGMGGLGKTTLAKKVYNDAQVENHFHCRAWAFISQQYSTRDILLGIRADVRLTEQPASNSEEDLVKNLHKFLKGKRYLIVLDDIWRVEAWDGLKNAFPDEYTGSKVLFTTRNKDVASYADPWSPPIEPPLLNEKESWELFCRKAFPSENVDSAGDCPSELEQPGREMLRKCQGLPLAVVVLGGMLATKKLLREWEAVQLDLSSHLKMFERTHEYGGVFGILALSYYDLPYYLKPCFMYLGHFPEDWAIPKGKLIRLWIAEGFADPEMGGFREESVEDIAEGYFEQLVSRCLVQVWGKGLDNKGTGAKICRVHDLMRDLSLSKAREESFLGIIQSQKDKWNSSDVKFLATTNSRRIAFHYNRYVDLIQAYHRVRSLLFFSPRERPPFFTSNLVYSYLIDEFKNFRLLRVLDLQGLRFGDGTIGGEIGKFFHLRYLCLRDCRLRNLPESIGNLQSLYTLDLRGNTFPLIPNIIWKLKLLRHFLVDRWFNVKLGTFTNLQRVKLVLAECIINNAGLFKSSSLRHLGIAFCSQKELEMFLESSCVRLERLWSLYMDWNTVHDGASRQSLEPLSHCRSLFKLRLNGTILEHGFSKTQSCLKFLPQNLSTLTLEKTVLELDPMPMLEKLPSLRILHLWSYSYTGVEMVCSTNGFPQLEFLKVSGLWNLQTWTVEEVAFPRLRTLWIDNLSRLQKLPTGLKFVHTLQELIVSKMSRDFRDRLRSRGEYDNILHVPKVTYHEYMEDDILHVPKLKRTKTRFNGPLNATRHILPSRTQKNEFSTPKS